MQDPPNHPNIIAPQTRPGIPAPPRPSRSSKLQLADRLVELPFQLLPPARARISTWSLTPAERERVRILWPSTYQWAPAARFTETVKRSFARLGVLRIENTPQNHRGVVSLRCTVDGRSHIVAIDYADRPNSINEDALAECSLYIKFQFHERGYRDSRIIAGGYPVSGLDYYWYYRSFRTWHEHRSRIDVLGRFSFEFQGELRARAVGMLSDARDIRYVGAGPRVRYSRFLREAASARLSLDLPGNGPFTFRVAEFLGLGTCLVAPRYVTALHERLEPGVHYVQIADDLSDLLDVCSYYLSHENERAKIARAGRDFFERYLHSDHLAGYYIRALLHRLGNDGEPVTLLKGSSLDQDHGVGVAQRDARHR